MPNVSDRELSRLKNSVSELSALNQIANAINVTMSVDKISQIILENCLKRVGASQGAIFLLDDKDQEIDKFKTFVREINPTAGEIPFHLNVSLTGWMIKNKSILLSNDPDGDDRFAGMNFKAIGIRSVLAAPLLSRSGLIGVLVLFNKKVPEAFGEHDRRFLGIVGTQTAKVIENARLFESQKKLVAIKEEMRLATDIQKGFLPGENIVSPRFEVYGFNRPAREMGGDYYDMVPLSDDRIFISLGDVSGKGMPAALLMANAQAVLRSQLSKTKDIPLPELAENLNRLICQFTPPEQYITAMFGVYDASENKLSYINAGHCPPFIIRKTDAAQVPAEAGLVIGVLPDFTYSVNHIELAAGEMVFIYSDGITEAWNEKDEEFGEERLHSALSRYSGESAVDLGEEVYGQVVRHRGRQEQSDDITIVILRAV